jgi:hypothetical protein
MEKFTNLKNMTISDGDGKDPDSTQFCQGGAKDSPVMNETNTTKAYRPAKTKMGELGDGPGLGN